MNKKIYLISLFVILVIPLILAIEINIKTYSDHKISVIIRNAGELTSLDSFHQPTGDGNVKITSSSSPPIIDLLVSLKNKEGIKILDRKFEGVLTNKPININFVPGNVGLVTEESSENDTNNESTNPTTEAQTEQNTETELEKTETTAPTTKETEENNKVEQETSKTEEITETANPKITGKAVENLKLITSKYIYYIMGVIVFIIALFFVARFVRDRFGLGWSSSMGGFEGLGKGGKGDKFRVVKYSAGYDRELSHAERKLESAQRELEYLRNRRKMLQEAREKLRKDERDLRKLESGD